MNSIKKISFSIVLLFSLISCSSEKKLPIDIAQQCFVDRGENFSEVLDCYRSAEATQDLQYKEIAAEQIPGLQKRRFELISQNWSPNDIVQPANWKHTVDITIPENALKGRALLIANNGINIASDTDGMKPSNDFTAETINEIAKKTQTIIVSVDNVPNQYLTYLDDGTARREDSSVAHSWKLFMQDSKARPFMSLHVPMMETMVKTMDLAEKELQPWKIQKFIATGASKRGWAAWLAAIADSRIEAIVPFVIDVLSFDQMLEHTYQTYGKNWPLAFIDYRKEDFTEKRKTAGADQLSQILDPLRYLATPYAHRLEIPKYIVNASGDDFFVPDNTKLYFDKLPGKKTFRTSPNSCHARIRGCIPESIITFINRMQRSEELPTANTQIMKNSQEENSYSMHLEFSETPVKVIQWVAVNSAARDFRFNCGIKYEAKSLDVKKNLTAPLETPAQGWSSSFVEATFADGFVITSPVQILPETYPTQAPPVLGAICRTIH